MTKNLADFTPKVIKELSRRVGSLCSNPKCRAITRGPHENPNKSVNIGEAAHISAAKATDKRYDKNMTDEERGRIENGIWLCKNCHKLVDSDEQKYTIEILKEWKDKAERYADEHVGLKIPTPSYAYSISAVAVANQLDHLAEVVGEGKAIELQESRNAWREGRKEEAEKWVKEVEMMKLFGLHSPTRLNLKFFVLMLQSY